MTKAGRWLSVCVAATGCWTASCGGGSAGTPGAGGTSGSAGVTGSAGTGAGVRPAPAARAAIRQGWPAAAAPPARAAAAPPAMWEPAPAAAPRDPAAPPAPSDRADAVARRARSGRAAAREPAWPAPVAVAAPREPAARRPRRDGRRRGPVRRRSQRPAGSEPQQRLEVQSRRRHRRAGDDLQRFRLDHQGSAARLEHRARLQPEFARRIEQRLPRRRRRLVPQVVHGRSGVERPANPGRVRRRLHEQRGLDQRHLARHPPVRLHELRIRPDAQYITFGGNNVIAVRVNNNQPNSRWYSGSGIYRNVWLTKLNPVHVPYNGVFVTTPSVSTGSAMVSVATEVQNQSTSRRRRHGDGDDPHAERRGRDVGRQRQHERRRERDVRRSTRA